MQDGGPHPNFKRSYHYNSATGRPVLLKCGRLLYYKSLDPDAQLVESNQRDMKRQVAMQC